MTERIYFVGYMGAGKTTISRKIAQMLHWDWCDTDQMFEAKYKISIQDFFNRYDETLFRKLESPLLKETKFFKKTVVATGGGLPCFYDNMEWMNQNGLTVYLRISPESVVNRLESSKKKRPVLQNKNSEELLDFVSKHMRKRNIYYTQAHQMVKAESCDLKALHQLLQTILKVY